MTKGMPYLALMIHSPDSDDARRVYYDDAVSRQHGNVPLAAQHAFIRLFASMGDQGVVGATCIPEGPDPCHKQ